MSGNPFFISEPITLNRIRQVVQAESKLPEALRKFNALRLANDMNAMGANIKLKDNKGRWRTADELAEDIGEFVPNVEASCKVSRHNKGKTAEKAIVELAKKFNRLYGANILIHQLGDPRLPLRPMEKICDDLYMVSDKQLRALTDSVPVVKGALLKQIENLELQRKILNNRFSGLIAHLGAGKSMDEAEQQVKDAVALKQAMGGYMESELAHAKDQYRFLTEEYSKVVRPRLGELAEFLQNVTKRQYSKGDVGKSMLLEDMIRVYSKLGLGYNQCNDCLRKFDLRIQDYIHDGNFKQEEFAVALENAFRRTRDSIISGGNPNLRDFQEIARCHSSLLQDIKDCQAGFAPGEVLKHMLVQVDCSSLHEQAECDKNEIFCSWDGKDCKPKEESDVLSQLQGMLTGVHGELDAIIQSSVSDEPDASSLTSTGSKMGLGDLSALIGGGDYATDVFKKGY